MSVHFHDENHKPSFHEPRWVFITPDMAKEMVSKESTNRRVRPFVVRGYLEAMNSGTWSYSPHGVVLDESGCVSDGNHRMHALKDAAINGLWMLVADWRQKASELRVDLGSRRTLGDFNLEVNSGVVSAATALGKFLNILSASRTVTPDDLAPVLDGSKVFLARLLTECSAAVRGRSSAPVRAAFCAYSFIEKDHARLARIYRSFVLNDSERSPGLITLARAMETRRMDGLEIFARTYYYLECGNQEKPNFKNQETVIERIRSVVTLLLLKGDAE